MEVVLHDEEDVLRGGEAFVLAFPLLPAFWAQLGEVVHQALATGSSAVRPVSTVIPLR